MPADNSRRRNLVVVEIEIRWRVSKQVLLKVSIHPAKHGMRNHRAMLVVWPQPFSAAHKEVLLHKWSPDRPTIGAVGVGPGAAGANISPTRRFDSPVPAQPVRAFHVQAAQVRSL